MSLLRRANPVVLTAILAAACASCDAPDAAPVSAEPLSELAPLSAPPPRSFPAASASASAPTALAADAGPALDASANGPVDALSDAATDAAPPLPSFADDPPSDEKTKPPEKAEWKTAQSIRVDRSTESSCTAKRIREWVRIWCGGWYHSMSLVSGTREGISMGGTEIEPSGMYVVFPARRGDRRLILVQSRSKWSAVPAVLLSEQWLETDKAPIISVLEL
jgi:hypothetical protein